LRSTRALSAALLYAPPALIGALSVHTSNT
jgi:hypothetical protein